MILKKINLALKEKNMLSKGRKITIALSGGADSVCLLHAMLTLAPKLNLEISAAHLNHCIRGDEALRDENFVNKLCSDLSVPLFCERADVPLYAEQNKLSLELAARRVRYDFLNRVSGGGLIATAHNADDNLETVILNLTRGTAAKGLCGIPSVRDNIIRPLIYCTRAEIETYCKENGLEFVTDSTNLTDDYTRNKIRHNVIPILREINPMVESAAARACSALELDDRYLQSLALSQLEKRIIKNGEMSLKGLENQAEAINFRMLKAFCESIGITELSQRHLNQLYGICISGGEISLPGKTLKAQNGILKIKENSVVKPEFSVTFSSVLKSETSNAKKINNLLLKSYLDCDKIVGKLTVRTRMSGDSVKLKNKNGTKILKKLYTEYKIPTDLRDAWPVISDSEGIVWIYKIGVAERAATDGNSSNIIKINVAERFGDNNERI